MRWIIIVDLVALYIHTWFGGQQAHQREMRARASQNFDAALRINENSMANGSGPLIKLLPSPRSKVEWCFPILPGVLYAHSWYSVGPLSAGGGDKIVIYYGFGSFTLLELYGWRA